MLLLSKVNFLGLDNTVGPDKRVHSVITKVNGGRNTNNVVCYRLVHTKDSSFITGRRDLDKEKYFRLQKTGITNSIM